MRFFLMAALVSIGFAVRAGEVELALTTGGGWQELLVVVDDVDGASHFFTNVARWEIAFDGQSSQRLLNEAEGGVTCPCSERLLKAPGGVLGMVRLLAITSSSARPARSSAQIWESGGFAGFNVRVSSIDRVFHNMQRNGWHGYSDPVRFDLEAFTVKESILQGPDGLTVGLIERVDPPLTGFGHIEPVSRAFNVYQVVSDFDRARRFYTEILDFRTYLKTEGVIAERGENLFALPYDVVSTRTRRLEWLQPEGENEGSVAVMAFDGLPGRDFSSRAAFPNRGLMALRYGVESSSRRCANVEGVVAGTRLIRDVEISPYGVVDLCRVPTPDGGYVEFLSQAE